MSDENDDINQDAMADEWAAAMAQQDDEIGGVDPDELLAEAQGGDVQAQPLDDFSASVHVSADGSPDLDVVLDIPVNISMEVGNTEITIRNLLQLSQGSVIELDRLAGEPLDVLVNGTLIAHGEVVVVNEKFGIRMTDVISPSERIKKLK
jgi:flagellar motor switch protein FliN/FliY